MRQTRYGQTIGAASAGLLMLLVASGTPFAFGGTASVNVDLDVPAVITLNTASCASGTAGVTDFGTVTAGSSVVTTSDCTITFGASNNTAMLRINQADKLGLGMWMPSTGTLDTAFDTDGKATTAIASGANQDNGNSVKVQADGKIITGGYCDMGGATGTDVCLARYTASGALDTSFDTDGKVTTAIAPGTGADEASGVAVQPDGKIITAGSCDMGATTAVDFCVARFTSNGSLDTTFDTDGKQTTTVAPFARGDYAFDVALQPDGKIIAAGGCPMNNWLDPDICVVRYTSSGALDTSFDTDGKQTLGIGPAGGTDYAESVIVQPDGKVVTTGYCNMGGSTGYDICLSWFTSSGAVANFVTTSIAPSSGDDYARSAALQADGKIIVAGRCNMAAPASFNYDFCLARYTSAGGLDSTFDNDGKVTTAIAPGSGSDLATGVMVQPDGRIIVSGYCDMGGSTGHDFCMARFTSSGALDTTFDTDGKLSVAIGPGSSSDFGDGLAVQTDGKIITSGSCGMSGSGYDMCLVSLAAGGSFQQHADGTNDWDQGTNMFGACLRSLSGGTAGWTTNATCPSSDGAYWNDVPATPEKIANTATTGTITANFRFGLRTASNQPPGAYIAPITFDVIAPNV